ncbi:MAG: hypothetical protein ACOC2J_03785 [bacterium]
MLKKLYTKVSNRGKAERVYKNLDDLNPDKVTMLTQYIGNY